MSRGRPSGAEAPPGAADGRQQQRPSLPPPHPAPPSPPAVCALLDQMGAMVGVAATPSAPVVRLVIGLLLLVNSLGYVFMLQVLYSIVLRGMGYAVPPMPAFVARAVDK